MVHETNKAHFRNPTDYCLAQLVEHKNEDLDVVGSIPTGDNFYFDLLSMLAEFCQDLAENSEL